MKWITREKVKVDRVACPWLIKKFADPDAEFGFLPHDNDWANVHDGTVYDVPGCELGHHGEQVSFDAILRKYGLTDPALLLLAQVVPGMQALRQPVAKSAAVAATAASGAVPPAPAQSSKVCRDGVQG